MVVRPLVVTLVLLAGWSVCVAAPVPARVLDYPAAHLLPGEVPGALAVDCRGYTYLAGQQTTAVGGHAAGSLYVTRIDPSGERRLYTAYLGGSGLQQVTGAAVDEDGYLYIAGYTSSRDFPVIGGVQSALAGRLDSFVAKLDPKGQSWVFSTYLGGTGDDLASSIAVDRQANVYITGSTSSADFPVKNAAEDVAPGDSRGFLAKISADGGTLSYATYLRGSGRSVTVDSSGSAYVAGSTTSEGSERPFWLKTTTDGSTGGSFHVLNQAGEATSIALDSQGAIYLAGDTGGAAPLAFAARFAPNGERVYYTTVAGTDGGSAPSIGADSLGNAYVASGPAGLLVKLSPGGDRQLASVDLPRGNLRIATAGSGRVVAAGTAITGEAYLSRVSTCASPVSQSAKVIPSSGGADVIALESAPECEWKPAASAPWIELAEAAAGSDSLSYRVAVNLGPERTGTIEIGDESVTVRQEAGTLSQPTNVIRDNPGFRTSSLPACDDCSSPRAVDLGFSIDFYGRTFSQVWVNANGTVSFDAPGASYTPRPLHSLQRPAIAPFWADADTRHAAPGAISYGSDLVDGRPAFGVNWSNVGRYSGLDNESNDFQLVLIDRSDAGPGQFDIEMNYAGLAWDAGEASGSNAARAGFTNGTGQPGTWLELPGSGERAALLDGGSDSLAGRHTFSVRTAESTAADPGGAATRTARSIAPAALVAKPTAHVSAGAITEYTVPISSSEPFGITAGPDAALWFTDEEGYIGRMTTAGAVTSAPNYDGSQIGIVAGPDGALWFTDTTNSKIGRISTAGAITEYATPSSGSTPHSIASGPDGNLWFTEYGTGKIGRITPAGVITEYPLAHSYYEPQGIASGPDGALWFTEYHAQANNIGRITIAGQITEYPIPTANAGAVGIVTGSDHNLWFTEYIGNKIGQVSTTGSFQEFPLSSTGSEPYFIAAGPDGALWFTQYGTSQIGTITVGGSITEYPIPTANALPAGIVAGPDGAIWFTEWNKSKIGRVVTSATNPPALSITKTHTGNFNPGQQGATYTVTVSNTGTGATSGTVAVTDLLPGGLTLVSMSGSGWNCPNGGPVCTCGNVLAAGQNYPAITVTVNVAAAATSPQVNFASVTGGGLAVVATASDSTIINSAPSLGTLTEFLTPISSSEPYGITAGPDGALWFTDLAGYIGRMTTNGSATEAADYDASQVSIVTGPDGALWFTDTGNNKIGRITAAGVVTEYATPTTSSAPHFIIVGPDGNLWFTEYGTGKIGRITPAGVITEFPLSHTYNEPQGITVGPDGALWFTEAHPQVDSIGRITTAGVVTEFALPTASANPVGIVTGPDGNLWFTEYGGNKIGQMTTAGVFTEFPLLSSGSEPWTMVLGPDGAMWFLQYGTGQIGRITTGGLITEYNIPTANALPAGITVGPDGAIWFTEWNKGKIGRVVAGNTDPPVLSIAKSHSGNFAPAQQGATYSVTVSNAAAAGPTAGTVTVTEMPPGGMTLVSMAGDGWNCPNGGNACTRQDPLAGGNNYPAITVTVNVALNATTPQVNAVSVAGGGSGPASASDSTTIESGVSVGTLTEYPVPITGSEPYGITSGPDGALWFTDLAGYIGRMTTAGSVTEAADYDASQVSIVTGPDGALWFTDTGNNKIGRISTGGLIAEYATPTTGSAPHFIVVGPDGNLWFTEYGTGKIGRITTAGVITEFPLSHTYNEPQGITVGPDGALWFTEAHPQVDSIGRITTAGVVTEFAIPTASANPVGIVTGPDGNLWFTEYGGDKIGQMTPAGVFTEFPLASSGSEPWTMVLGPDGAMWFLQYGTSQIGRITTSGLVTEYNIPTANALPAGITVGPDGAIWFTEWNKSKIGRIVQGQADPPVLTIAVTHDGYFTPSQKAATYTLMVADSAGSGATTGTVTVNDSVTSGLTLVSMSGDGWSCPAVSSGAPSGSCTRNDVLTAGQNYPAITVTVNVNGSPNSPQVDEATVAGGGSAPASANDAAIVTSLTVGSFTEYKPLTAGSGPNRIVTGSDGALWFTEYIANKIGRLTTAGAFTEYTVPTAASQPTGIAAGPDNALWFTERNGNKIGKITTGGVFSEYNIPTAGSEPVEMVAGPDGALWFGEYGTGKIGRASVSGVITEYPLAHSYYEPFGITAGPDGALWFTEYHVQANNIGRITTAGAISEFAIPTGSAGPIGIVTGPDGALWFAESNGNKIGRITLNGVFSEYPIPNSGSGPADLVVGPDGAIWFTEEGANMIGRMTADGVLAQYAISTNNSEPIGISVGSDNAVWFAEYNGGKIGRTPVGGPVVPVLSITKTHAANFQPGQQGAAYTVTVSNVVGAGSTSGTVTVTENLPPGMTLVSMAGTGWTCPGATCTRSDALLPGASYPPITVTVNVTSALPEEVINQVSVALAGVVQATASDLTIIGPYSPCDVTKAGNTTVADVQIIVNEALGLAAGSNDLNGDGVLNVVDIQIAIDAVLGFGCVVQ